MLMKPDSYLWKALEFYGRRIHHPGKWRVFDYLLKSKDTVGYSSDMEVERLGLNWKLNPSDFVEGWLYWTGEFEGGDWYHFSRLIQPGAVVFDVGANCGYYSLLTGAMLRERVKVVAFEPSPRTFPRLRTNISLNLLNSSI